MLYKRGNFAMHNIVDLLRAANVEQEAVINKAQSVVLNIRSGFHTKRPAIGGPDYIGDTLDCNDTNQRDNCQDSSQTVENPFARRHVNFQIVHRVVHTV